MTYAKAVAAVATSRQGRRWRRWRWAAAGAACVGLMVSCTAMSVGNAGQQALMLQQGLAGTGGCVPAGPVILAAQPGTSTDEQLRNAQTIVNAAPGGDMHAARIAIATAIVESGLRNLDHGNSDSLGLFQQRPSQGWGTPAQIMDPAYAAGKFYEHLLAVPGWTTMDDGAAAQAVQRSAFPGRYADAMPQADQWLARVGGPSGAQAAVTSAATAAPCAAQQVGNVPQDPQASGDGMFTDGPQVGYVTSSKTPAEAIAWARAQEGSTGWYRLCLRFVARATGGWIGVPYAIDAYWATPPERRHDVGSPEGRQPSPGAALFYTTGSRAGHVALYLGGGMIASNDIITDGVISIVPASTIETKWHSTYVGWATP